MHRRLLLRRAGWLALALALSAPPAAAFDDTPVAQLATPAINALGLRQWAAALLGREDDGTRWVRIGPGETVRRDAARGTPATRGGKRRAVAGDAASAADGAAAGAATAPAPDSAARSRAAWVPGEGAGTSAPGPAQGAVAADSAARRPFKPRVVVPLDGQGEPDAHHAPPALAARVVSPSGAWPVVAELSLPLDAEAKLELFDLAGRRLLFERLSPARPGTRRLTLDFASRAAGIYWLRLEQAGRAAVADVVVRR